jgi:DNA repair exonuclease SbcCD nuclease subunit
MFELGAELWKSAIEELEKHFNEIEIRNIAGNHDRQTSYYLYSLLKARYEDRKKITFGEHTRELQGLVFGKNLIVWHHGDVNFKRLIKSISTEFREEWGLVNVVELHLGHLHSEMVLEDNGLIARRNSTPKSTDYYEYHERRVLKKFRWVLLMCL